MKVKMEGKSDLDPEVFGLKPPPDQDGANKKNSQIGPADKHTSIHANIVLLYKRDYSSPKRLN